jgi:hypothetical protein
MKLGIFYHNVGLFIQGPGLTGAFCYDLGIFVVTVACLRELVHVSMLPKELGALLLLLEHSWRNSGVTLLKSELSFRNSCIPIFNWGWWDSDHYLLKSKSGRQDDYNWKTVMTSSAEERADEWVHVLLRTVDLAGGPYPARTARKWITLRLFLPHRPPGKSRLSAPVLGVRWEDKRPVYWKGQWHWIFLYQKLII